MRRQMLMVWVLLASLLIGGRAEAVLSIALTGTADDSAKLGGVTPSAFTLTLLDEVDAAAWRTALGTAIGTDVQAYNANLAAIAGLTSANNKGLYFTGSGTAAVYDLSAFGRTLANATNAEGARTSLGVGTIGTQNSDAVAITGGTIAGMTSIDGTDSTLTGTLSADTVSGENLSVNNAIVNSDLDVSGVISGDASGATSLNATSLASGTVAAARGGAGTISGLLKANGSGTVSAAVAGTDYVATGKFIRDLDSIFVLSPADATVYYTGSAGYSTTANSRRVYVPYACTLKKAYMTFTTTGTLSSAETSNVAIRVNDTTDTALVSSITCNSVTTNFSNTSLNLSLSAGDSYEIKWTTPTWTTNPTNVLTHVTLEFSY